MVSKKSKNHLPPQGQGEKAQGTLTHEGTMGDPDESRFCGAKDDEGFTAGSLTENRKQTARTNVSEGLD